MATARITKFDAPVNGHMVKFHVESSQDLTPAEIQERIEWARDLENELRGEAAPVDETPRVGARIRKTPIRAMACAAAPQAAAALTVPVPRTAPDSISQARNLIRLLVKLGFSEADATARTATSLCTAGWSSRAAADLALAGLDEYRAAMAA